MLDRSYFDKFYTFKGINFCKKSQKATDELNLYYEKNKKYLGDDFCSEQMWRDQSNIIVYDTNNYRTCNIKFLYLKENMDTTIIEINKMFTQRMELKNKYKNYIQKMWPSLFNSYIGCHIRTWGYFNDFKDFITRERFNKTVTTFNLEKVKRTVLKFVNANNKQLYLSTESIKLKTILKDFFERRL